MERELFWEGMNLAAGESGGDSEIRKHQDKYYDEVCLVSLRSLTLALCVTMD